MLNVRLDETSRANLRAAVEKYSVEGVHMSESEFARRAIKHEVTRTIQRNGIKVTEKQEVQEVTLTKDLIEMLEDMRSLLNQIDKKSHNTEAWVVLIAREMGVQL